MRTDRATFVLPMGTRGGLVLSTYFGGLADKPVVVDGYAAYPASLIQCRDMIRN